MKNLTNRAFYTLFAIIIIEGYVVLSSELIAMRVTMPFIGSGTDVVSIIIAAVLLPLSFGYYVGGQFAQSGSRTSLRQKLAKNVLISSAFLAVGLSYIPLNYFMEWTVHNGVHGRLFLAGIYSLLFLVTPVFLLGQTIPLISNYFRREALARITGKILFASTIGSFMGATFSTLVLMATIGVHYTAALNIILLGFLYMLLVKKRGNTIGKACMGLIVLFGVGFNSDYSLATRDVVANNQYSVIQVVDIPDSDVRVMSLNHNSDSAYSPSSNFRYGYVQFIEDNYIYSRNLDEKPLNVLILGAGGFTIGLNETENTYHYVDIDASLKKIAEEDFLKQELGPNKIFHPVSAESFLIETTEKYDLIVLDVFQGDLNLPENLVTQDFFKRVRSRLAEGGIVVSNFALNPAFGNAFARNLDHTFRSVFPLISRHIIGDHNAWDKDEIKNVMYVYTHTKDEDDLKIYTDNKNTVYYDKPSQKAARE